MKENKTLSSIRGWLYHKRVYAIAFAIPVLLMFIVYATFGVYPFGDNSVLVLDLNGQYIYYYEAYRDALWGDGSLLFSWSRNLTGEMAGIFAYYLASPFSIIIALFPRSMILEAVLVMQLFKLGAAAVAFAYYIRRSKRVEFYSTLIFSTLYALMAYAVVQLMDPMWLDGLIYLPLIVYGVENLVDKGKKLALIIPLGLMFIAHFYIGWMVAFFTAIYFICYLFFGKKDEDVSRREIIKAGVNFTISAVVATMCAAVIILPVYYSLKLGKLEFTEPNYSLKPQFVLLDLFGKFLPQSYDTVRPEGLPIVYCGVLTLFMVPLYFCNVNIRFKRKVGNAILLTSILLSMYLSTIDLAWHGFQVPNWLPYRYSFVFCFVLLAMATESLERIEGITFRNLGTTMIVLIGYVIYVDSLKKPYLETTKAIWFSLLCIVGYGILLYYYKKHATVKSAGLILMILVAGELYAGTYETLKSIDKDVVYSKHSSYVGPIADGRKIMDELTKVDNGLYRTEKTFYRTVNDPMAWRMKALTHSSSTLNAGPIKLMESLGFTTGGHYTKYKGDTLLTDDLFGVKYVITKDKPVYYTEQVLTQDDMTIYKNPNSLAMAFLVDENIQSMEELAKNNPFENQNKLLAAMLGTEDNNFFTRVYVDQTLPENVETTMSGDHTKYRTITEGQNSQVEFLITAPTNDLLYMYLPSSFYHAHEMNIWVNNQFLDQYYETDNYCIKTLGRFNAGETVSVIATIIKNEALMKDQWFYTLDEQKLDVAMQTLKKGELNITKFSETYIEGNVTSEAGQMLMTTISYEPGWTIKVDGNKVEPVKLADALIGIPLGEGAHTITMSFFPHGLARGIVISGIGVLAVIAIAVLENKNKKTLLKRLYN